MKNPDGKKNSMVFPFRWFDMLNALGENNSKIWKILEAIRNYAEFGKEPNFTGFE